MEQDSKILLRKNRILKNKSKGFSLFEVIVTILLLVVGFTTLLRMFSISMFADAEVENRTTALYLAQEAMDGLRDAASFAAVTNSTRANLGGDFADFDREVVVTGDPKQVSVAVYWDVKGDEQMINAVSLFANYDY